ncbi:unnamed protein product [Ectocarpus sp. CCAP 1310/34]|nr:unnamed protein product [Ectocarpus sp. CCAP 1310/34]
MGAIASRPLDIEAFRPPPPEGTTATLALPAPAASMEAEATSAPSSSSSSSGGSVTNGHHQEPPGPATSGGVFPVPLLRHLAERPGTTTEHGVTTGKRSHQTDTDDDDDDGGEAEHLPSKRAARELRVHHDGAGEAAGSGVGLVDQGADGSVSPAAAALEVDGARTDAFIDTVAAVAEVASSATTVAHFPGDHGRRPFHAALEPFSAPMNRTGVGTFDPGDGARGVCEIGVGNSVGTSAAFPPPLPDQPAGIPFSVFAGGAIAPPQLVRPDLVVVGHDGRACGRDASPSAGFAEVAVPLAPLPRPSVGEGVPVGGALFGGGGGGGGGGGVHPSALPLPDEAGIDVGTEAALLSSQQPLRSEALSGGVPTAALVGGAPADHGEDGPRTMPAPGDVASVPNSQQQTQRQKPRRTMTTTSAASSSSRRAKKKRRTCGMEGCKRRPLFGAQGTRRPQFCSGHKPAGFVNVASRRCEADGCGRQPSFGAPESKPQFCAAHRSEGMLNLAAPRCVTPGCLVVPSFARQGSRRASACAAHRKAGDVDVVTRRCHQEGCVRRPVFGYGPSGGGGVVEQKRAHYCNAHKLEGMVNVFAARCAAAGCEEKATFGPPGVKKPTRCARHRTPQHQRITTYHS